MASSLSGPVRPEEAASVPAQSAGGSPNDADDERVCPECLSDRIVSDPVRGERVCDACGLVVQETAIDPGPEWSAYSMEEVESRAHAGAPRDPLRGSSGLATVISPGGRDAHGNPVRTSDQRVYHRLRQLQRRATYSGPGERSLPELARALDRYASILDLPRAVRDEAGLLGRKAVDGRLLRGRSTEAVAAGILYAACRIRGVPRTLEEITQATGLPKKTLGRVYRTIRRHLSVSVPAPQATEYVRRFSSVLGLSPRVEEEALRVVNRFDGGTSGRSLSPAGTTAAAVYLACLTCGESRSQAEVARVSGVSEVTLRNRYKAMRASESSQTPEERPRFTSRARRRIPRGDR